MRVRHKRKSKFGYFLDQTFSRRLTRQLRLVSTLVLLCFGAIPTVLPLTKASAADAASTPDEFDEKHYQSTYKMVETLINKSSLAVATSQEQSGDTPQDARYFFEQAKKAHQQGDKQGAAEFLEKAKKAMFSAGKKAGSAESHTQKLSQDFQKKIDSADAMLDALKRIHKEKPRGEEGEQLERQVADKISVAKQSKQQGNIELAKQQADAAFLLAKQSVINLRDGDTLVRSLNFANKAEEYKYELDRNNTHKMLVKLLLQEKMQNADVKKHVDEKMQEAEKYRQQAEAAAGKSQFEEAVGLLEQSTKFIIHAIRAAGIYIPG